MTKYIFFEDEYGDVGSGSGSPGMCAFTFCSGKFVGGVGKYVGGVSGIGSGVFVPTRIESIGDVFCWSFLYQEESSPKVVDS